MTPKEQYTSPIKYVFDESGCLLVISLKLVIVLLFISPVSRSCTTIPALINSSVITLGRNLITEYNTGFLPFLIGIVIHEPHNVLNHNGL